MGCDYYIYKYLKINFQGILPLFIKIEEEKGYFNFYLDEDDNNYEEKYEKYVKDILTSVMKPIIIYEKNEFINNKLENKYKLLIDKNINIYNSNQSHDNNIEWKDILDIKKVEIRDERE